VIARADPIAWIMKAGTDATDTFGQTSAKSGQVEGFLHGVSLL
jgi:hypothetical protein